MNEDRSHRTKPANVAEYHSFEKLGSTIAFNVETMLFYEATPLAEEMLALFATGEENPASTLRGRHGRREVKETMEHLRREKFLRPTGNGRRPPPRRSRGVRNLELMVTHACNMRCRYCYGAAGTEGWGDGPHLYGSQRGGMSPETARAGVGWLFDHAPPGDNLSISFFGGEPLLERELLEELVPYIRKREEDEERQVNLSLSTNGLLLDEDVVAFLQTHHIGCQVSIDGPPEIQDRNRCLAGGEGSYHRIAPGLDRLLRSRPGRVPARVTVAGGAVRLRESVEHLLELGFSSVHAEPAICSGPEAGVAADDVDAIIAQDEDLAAFLVESVSGGRIFNYANLVGYIRRLRVVRERLAYGCGAGRTFISLSQDGEFYPCHRFVGMAEYRMGSLEGGLDTSLQDRILGLTVDERPGCRECWARYLCGGGCWKHAVDLNGALERPDENLSCRIVKNQIECAMAVNSGIRVEDHEVLAELYEDTADPYKMCEKGG